MLINGREKLLSIAEGKARLLGGNVVIFPTDTVWGVGARWKNAKAVETLYQAKQQPVDNPFGILVANLNDIEELGIDFDSLHPQQHRAMAKLMKAFWPGSVSLVLPWPTKPLHYLWPQPTISLRIPNHPVTLELLRHVGPIVQSSANISGGVTPTTFEAIEPTFISRTSGVVAGEAGGELGSTVIDLTDGDRPRILRAGAVPMFDIERVIA